MNLTREQKSAIREEVIWEYSHLYPQSVRILRNGTVVATVECHPLTKKRGTLIVGGVEKWMKKANANRG